MRKIIGYTAIFLASGLIASQVTSQSSRSSMPDPAKEYHQAVDCHNAYDRALADKQGGMAPSATVAAWMKAYEDNARAGIKCPAPLPEMSARGGRWVLKTREGQNLAVRYAEDQKDPAAMSELGYSWLSGTGKSGTTGEGLRYLQTASTLGDPVAMFTVGTLHASGVLGYAKDHKMAFPLLEKAAAAGHVDALHRSGLYLLDGIGTRKDPKRAFAAFKSAAERGHMYSAIMAWTMLNDGNGVKKDPDLAYRLARAVAAQGEAYGAVMAAGTLLQRKDVLKHEDEILYWIDQAVARGDERIRTTMGPMRQQVVAIFNRAKAPPAYQPRAFKACPMKTVCLVDRYSGVQQCTTNKDYWSDCDG